MNRPPFLIRFLINLISYVLVICLSILFVYGIYLITTYFGLFGFISTMVVLGAVLSSI